MTPNSNPHWVYNQTIKKFAANAAAPFEDDSELEKHWGRV